MIEHIVLLKLKDGTPEESVARMIEGLKGLQSKVPGILAVSVGTNFSERSKGFTHGLVMRFEDKAALEAYLPHPAHEAVAQELVLPIIDDFVRVNYEI